MIQDSFFAGIEPEKQDVADVMAQVTVNCDDCRLAALHPANKGLCYRGNVNAKIAVLYEAPHDAETERGVVLIGHTGKEFERWMRILNLNSREELFMTAVIQCQPPKVKKNGVMLQREPDSAEIRACFGPRALRVLRAMPNLETVITLSWSAAKALLGPNVKAKTHDAQWFESSLLPGIPIFCLPDPNWVIQKFTPERDGTIKRDLDYFRREFLMEHKTTALALEAKADRESKGLGLL